MYKPFLKKFENKEDIIVMQVVATIATCLFKRLEASHKKQLITPPEKTNWITSDKCIDNLTFTLYLIT